MSTQTVAAERTCTGCGETLPLTAFTFDAKGWNGRASRCRPCTQERKRGYGSPTSEVAQLVEHAPDPAPARALRLYLLACRTSGRDFDTAWTGRAVVLLSLPPLEHQQWRVALNSTREAWRSAYEDEPAGRRALHYSLLD